MAGKVLIVEDDSTMAEMIRDILESGGYEVSHAFDGMYALQFLGLESETANDLIVKKGFWPSNPSVQAMPDLVLSDCMMPRVDGLTLVTQMSQDDEIKKIPVIVLTTKPKMDEPFRALPNVSTFLVKPADPDQLLQVVADTIAKANLRKIDEA